MARATKNQTESTEVAIPQLTTDELRNINSFDDAISLLTTSLGGELVQSQELGDGFALLDDKDELIGKPCVFVTWNFSDGDFGEFVSCRVIVQLAPNTFIKYIVNDGSTGMYAQLRDVSDRQPDARMLFAAKGLRKSEYDNQFGHGVTYYIDTAAVK